MLDAHAALIYTMVLCSAADREMSDTELLAIGEIVRHLPIFQDYDVEGLPQTAAEGAGRLSAEDGLGQCAGRRQGSIAGPSARNRLCVGLRCGRG